MYLVNKLAQQPKLARFFNNKRSSLPFLVVVSEQIYIFSRTSRIKKMSLLSLNSSESNLFIHVFSGCDITSTIFGKEKTSLVKLFKANKNLTAISYVFCNLCSAVEAVTAL